MRGISILIVDDDADIRELIAMYLQEHGFGTIEAQNGEDAILQFRRHQPDLILLDVIMPGMDGYAVCDEIRKQSVVPIIFLTSKWESVDVIKGLESGGDDYITKPFIPDVLAARVKSNLRRVRFSESDVLVYGDLKINRHTFEVFFQGETIPFLAKELKLFIFLAERPKQVFSAEQLYVNLWDAVADGDERTVMVHISKIRRKLNEYAPNSVHIETVKGIGYRFLPYPEMRRD